MRGGRHLYLVQSAVTGAFKIGRSSNVERRLAELQTGSPFKLRIILVAEGQGGREKHLHRYLRRYRSQGLHKGEWFIEPALGSLPVDLYDMLNIDDQEWWMTDAGPIHLHGPV